MTVYLCAIVEGETEVRCLPSLLHRIGHEQLSCSTNLVVLKPSRVSRSAFLKKHHPDFKKKLEEARVKLSGKLRKDPSGHGLILILLDADEECPAKMGPSLLERAKLIRSDIDMICVFAKREFENWFLAAAESLSNVNGLPDNLSFPGNAEDGNAEVWLTKQLQLSDRLRKYKKTVDAIEFVRKMNLSLCRQHSPSFDKLCRDLETRVPKEPVEERTPPPDDRPGSQNPNEKEEP